MPPKEGIWEQVMTGWKVAVMAPTCWCRTLEDWERGPFDHITTLGGPSPLDRQLESLCAQQSLEFLLVVRVAAYPPELGQRVAVIVIKPDVLLMDEPLSNLDALLRLQMRAELKRLHREIGTTTVYVTHDQIEALSLGDRIAVMREGEIVQLDTPTQVYDHPATTSVGGFIGTPPMNFLKAKVLADDKDVFLAIGDFRLEVPDVWKAHLREIADKTVILGIRAENIEVHPETSGGRLPANVIVAEPLGSQQLLTVQVGDDVLKVATKPDLSVQPGQAIGLALVKDKIRSFDVQTGAAITFS